MKKDGSQTGRRRPFLPATLPPPSGRSSERLTLVHPSQHQQQLAERGGAACRRPTCQRPTPSKVSAAPALARSTSGSPRTQPMCGCTSTNRPPGDRTGGLANPNPQQCSGRPEHAAALQWACSSPSAGPLQGSRHASHCPSISCLGFVWQRGCILLHSL